MGVVVIFRKVNSEELKFLQSASQEQWDTFCESDLDHFVDIDKAWDGINFVLTGYRTGQSFVKAGTIFGKFMQSLFRHVVPELAATRENALDWVIEKGEKLSSDAADGYGTPIQLVPSIRVKEAAIELEKLSEMELHSRFNPPAMKAAGVYLSEAWNRNPDESWEYLLDNFRVVKGLFTSAAFDDCAIIRFSS